MKLDDLRSILLSERETGRLTAVPPDLFDRGYAALKILIAQVYAFEDPLSEEARTLIEETLAIKETLQELFTLRSRKILGLTILHAEGNYYDREEVKRMIPAEKEMFEATTDSIERCRAALLYNVPDSVRATADSPPDFRESDETAGDESEEEHNQPVQPETCAEALPGEPGTVLVRVLEDTETFMGTDDRVYTLSKGDIVTLPERNAAVLSARNIVLNITLCK